MLICLGDMMYKFVCGIAAFLLFGTQAWSQDVIVSDPCPHPSPSSLDQMSERIQCLEERFDELRETQNLLLRTQQNLVKQLTETAAKIDYKIYGPPKELETFGAVKLAVTIGYWASGGRHQRFNCVPPLGAKNGKMLIGGGLSGEVRLGPNNRAEYGTGFRGCSPAPFCDSAGEFCNVQSRAAGCYVSSVWHTWYTEGQKRKNLPVKQSEICAG